MSEVELPTHWISDAPTSLHGNGAASFARTTRDAARVTCNLCRTLLARTEDDIAICDACRSGDCDDCTRFVWDDNWTATRCDCAESAHLLQRDIAEDEAADRALTAHYEERP